MCNKILSTLKKYIRLNLEDKICGIINNKDKVRLLSNNDLMIIMGYMDKIKKYPHCLMIYIFIKSEYRYDPGLIKLDRDFLANKCVLGELDLVKFALSDEVRKIYPIIENEDNKKENLRMIRIASIYGYIEIVKFLLSYEIKERYPSIDFYEWASVSMRAACESGHVEIVKFLLSDEIRRLHPSIISAVDPSSNNNNQILISSCGHGHLEVLKFLLSPEVLELYPKAQIDPSKNDNICIRVASRYGKEKIVRFLLSDEILERFPSIDPTAGNNEVISKFAACGNLDVVKFLLEFQDGRIIKCGLDDAMESAKNSIMPKMGKEILDLLIYYFNYSQLKDKN